MRVLGQGLIRGDVSHVGTSTLVSIVLADIIPRHINALYQHVEVLMMDIRRLDSAAASSMNNQNIVASNTSPETASLESHTNVRLGNESCSILIPASSETKAADYVFLGATSALTRSIKTIQSCLPSEKDRASDSQPAMLFENLYAPLKIDVVESISAAHAENLTGLYLRSIETTLPILSQCLIRETLDKFYKDNPEGTDGLVQTRLKLVLAVSFALLSLGDVRLQVVADAYVGSAISDGIATFSSSHQSTPSSWSSFYASTLGFVHVLWMSGSSWVMRHAYVLMLWKHKDRTRQSPPIQPCFTVRYIRFKHMLPPHSVDRIRYRMEKRSQCALRIRAHLWQMHCLLLFTTL